MKSLNDLISEYELNGLSNYNPYSLEVETGLYAEMVLVRMLKSNVLIEEIDNSNFASSLFLHMGASVIVLPSQRFVFIGESKDEAKSALHSHLKTVMFADLFIIVIAALLIFVGVVIFTSNHSSNVHPINLLVMGLMFAVGIFQIMKSGITLFHNLISLASLRFDLFKFIK